MTLELIQGLLLAFLALGIEAVGLGGGGDGLAAIAGRMARCDDVPMLTVGHPAVGPCTGECAWRNA